MKDLKDMTKEELKIIEDASLLSVRNMGVPKDLFHEHYGWILLDGKPTEAYKAFYEKELSHVTPEIEVPDPIKLSEDKESNIETPYENDKDRYKQLTVGMLREMLQNLPDDYEIKYDSAFGHIHKGDFLIYHDDKTISING